MNPDFLTGTPVDGPLRARLEVCAFNIQSCLIAERAGADRVELCDAPADGGTTPAYGTLRRVRERIGIDLYPIIRPRGGDFFYDEDEWAIIFQDIRMARELGCEGISAGCSLRDGRIDTERMNRIVEIAYPMGVTCHRVFDATPDLPEALEALIACGCERVLTSGGRPAAAEATGILRALVEQAADRIVIMPGAGVRSGNVRALKDATGATEFHTSARRLRPQDPARETGLDFGGVYIADEAELRAVIAALT